MAFQKRSFIAVLGIITAMQLAACADPFPAQPDLEPEPELAPDFAFVGELHNRALAQALHQARSTQTNRCDLAREEIQQVARDWPGGGLADLIAADWDNPRMLVATGCGEAPPISLLNVGSEVEGDLSPVAAGLVQRIMAAVETYPGTPVDPAILTVEEDAVLLDEDERELILSLASLTRASAEFWQPTATGGLLDGEGIAYSLEGWDDEDGARAILAYDAGGCLAGGLFGLRGGLQGAAGGCFVVGATASIIEGVGRIFGPE